MLCSFPFIFAKEGFHPGLVRRFRFHGDLHMLILRERNRLQRPEHAVFVDRLDDALHTPSVYRYFARSTPIRFEKLSVHGRNFSGTGISVPAAKADAFAALVSPLMTRIQVEP